MYYEKRVYVINPPNILVCADAADGKVLWQERLAQGTYWSSPVAADGKLYSLPTLGKTLNLKIERLPVSIRIVLESVLRNCDGKKVTEGHIRELAGWKPVAVAGAQVRMRGEHAVRRRRRRGRRRS